ncbi:MAG: AraC family transcriptional regulator [Pirellulales bacterium]|nr:AraC family transcriptional regulator [Pirellulales bacterium]
MAERSRLQPEFFSQQVRQARRFYLDLSPDKNKSLTVVCGGQEDCLPDYVVDRESFPYLSLEFVCRGRGALRLDGRSTSLSAGTVYTYGPGIPHTIIADPQQPFSKYFVDFVGRDAESLLQECDLAPGSVRQIAATLETQRILDDLIRDASQSSGMSLALCDTLLKYLLQKLAHHPPVAEHGNARQAYSTYLRCREHIEQHYVRLQSLTEIAKETFVDKAYLCRLFQLYDRQTPYQLLTRLKMKKAAEFLEDSDKLVKQVAHALGYTDPFHFSRTFKGVFGMSPQAFRRLRT